MISRILLYFVVLHATVVWGKLSSRSPSPVSFETLQPAHLIHWIALEYGSKVLIRKPTKKEQAAVGMDKLVTDD
jgi:hypothetical protein